MLAERGVVTLHANRGAFVSSPDAAEAHEVFEARRAVERPIVLLAAERIDAGMLAGLRANVRDGAAADKRLFDLPGFVLWRLAAAGVARAEWIGRDTCAETEDFFSNRRALHRGEADYGRLLSAILLE